MLFYFRILVHGLPTYYSPHISSGLLSFLSYKETGFLKSQCSFKFGGQHNSKSTRELRDNYVIVIWCNTLRVDVRIGHGVAQETNYKLLTTVVGIRYQANLCGVCDEVVTREAFSYFLVLPNQ